jgi:hypothetical protein
MILDVGIGVQSVLRNPGDQGGVEVIAWLTHDLLRHFGSPVRGDIAAMALRRAFKS